MKRIGKSTFRDRSRASKDFVTIGATELSTFRGHTVALGVAQWFEWRQRDGSVIAMPQLIQNVLDSGAFAVMAHPRDEGDPACCGCRWEHEDMMPGNLPAVEIWNGLWAERNEEALQLYYQWLNEGHKLVATSGTDMHRRPPEGARGAVNCIYAEAFSEAGLLAALKQGHSYVTGGPELHLSAVTASGQQGMMGDSLAAEALSLQISWQQAEPATTVCLIADGKLALELPCESSGEFQHAIEPGQASWCTVELRDDEGGLWAVTNPIFIG